MQIARFDIATPSLTRSLLAALPKAASELQAQETPPPAAPPMPQQAQQAQQQGALQNVAMLVTLANNEPVADRRRKAAQNADRGLKMLEGLHTEILKGNASPERLRELAAWTASVEVPDDPQMASFLRELDVRVRVELAKFDIEA